MRRAFHPYMLHADHRMVLFQDKTFTCVLWAKDDVLKSLNDPDIARQFFLREFPTFLDAIPLEDVVRQVSQSSLVPMCSIKVRNLRPFAYPPEE